jgi:hypothetical protein
LNDYYKELYPMAFLTALASDISGSLYTVNCLTGTAGDRRGTGLANLVGIAFSAARVLYGLTAFTDNALYTIDPTSGATGRVGITGLIRITEGDIAFDPTSSTLYGLQEVDAAAPNQLFTLDLATGLATIVGNVPYQGPPGGYSDLSAMAFDSAGNLFALDTQAGLLLLVDKGTAAVTRSVPLSGRLGRVAGMAFNAAHLGAAAAVVDGGDGAGNQLYLLDTATGQLTTVGPTGVPGGLAGLTF